MSRLFSLLLEKNNVDVTLVGFLSNIVYYTLLVVVLIAAAGQLGINTTSFLTIVGTAGLAVGLALKDSLSNFAAGVMLILFRPFRVGDCGRDQRGRREGGKHYDFYDRSQHAG